MQYTKRILPPFVIPECNITLENVWRYIVLYPDGTIDYDTAGTILGSYDNRTIRKHIHLFWQMIDSAKMALMESLSNLPGYAVLPKLKAGDTAYHHLALLVEQFELAAVRMGVAAGSEIVPVVVYVHGTYVFEKSRCLLKTTLNRVFHILLFFDTS